MRLLRSHNEVQAIVLNSIAAMTIKSKGGSKMFQPHIKQFYVRGSDPSHVKILKLEILTNLANSSNISSLLREFQSYINGSDAASVAATIQAIGRCAATITEVTETCLSGLVHLMSNKDPNVVAESVIEIKKLLQTEESEHVDIIVAMSKLVDTVEVLDLEDVPPSMPTPTLTPSLGGFLTPTTPSQQKTTPEVGQPMFVSTTSLELLNKVTSGGVGVQYRFTRHPHLYAPRMVAIELTFTNFSSDEIPVIKLGSKSLPPGMSLHEFPAVSNIPPDQARTVTLGVDFRDTTQVPVNYVTYSYVSYHCENETYYYYIITVEIQK